jgi:hypothetical protein
MMLRTWETETYDLVEALGWFKILKEVRIGNLSGCPFALVCRVVNHGCVPLALVIGVGFVRTTTPSQRRKSTIK